MHIQTCSSEQTHKHITKLFLDIQTSPFIIIIISLIECWTPTSSFLLQLVAFAWVCPTPAVVSNLTNGLMDVGWNKECVWARSLGCHSVISLVTIDLDSKIGQPPSWRRDSDNHVIHHNGTEPNAQVRNLEMVVNPHPHKVWVGHTDTHTVTYTQAYSRRSREDGLLALKERGRMFIFVSD